MPVCIEGDGECGVSLGVLDEALVEVNVLLASRNSSGDAERGTEKIVVSMVGARSSGTTL